MCSHGILQQLDALSQRRQNTGGTIEQEEADGNALALEISRSLSMTFITPIDREDIYAICIEQEEMPDLIQSVSMRVGLYGFHEAPASAFRW